MSATYSGDPSISVRDMVRFLVGDTDPRTAFVTDEEIDAILVETPSLYPACELLCEAQAAKFARLTTTSMGSTSVNYGQLYDQFHRLADRFRKLAQKGPTGKGFDKLGPVILIGGGQTYLGPDDSPQTYGDTGTT